MLSQPPYLFPSSSLGPSIRVSMGRRVPWLPTVISLMCVATLESAHTPRDRQGVPGSPCAYGDLYRSSPSCGDGFLQESPPRNGEGSWWWGLEATFRLVRRPRGFEL